MKVGHVLVHKNNSSFKLSCGMVHSNEMQIKSGINKKKLIGI